MGLIIICCVVSFVFPAADFYYVTPYCYIRQLFFYIFLVLVLFFVETLENTRSSENLTHLVYVFLFFLYSLTLNVF